MFCFMSKVSDTPSREAVRGMSCISPQKASDAEDNALTTPLASRHDNAQENQACEFMFHG